MNYLERLKQIKEEEGKLKNERENIVDKLSEEGKLDFNTWYKYGKKQHYEWIISREEAPLIRGLVEDCERYATVILDDLIDWSEDWSKEDLKKLHEEIIENQFGSMTIDW